jgi:hypothetical protein
MTDHETLISFLIALIVSVNKKSVSNLFFNAALIYHILTDFINALPGNSSVNTVQHATIKRLFSTSSAPRSVLVTDQRTRSLTRGTCFLCDLRQAVVELHGIASQTIKLFIVAV